MLHPEITDGTVLDYGSGYGKFLYTSNGEFPQENYTALDVNKNVLAEGKKFFPHANFVHSDAFNIVCNKTGVKDHRPVLQDQYYDTIISHAAVLEITTIEDSLTTIDWFYDVLRPGGKMLLSWLDVDNQVATDYYHKKRAGRYGSCDAIATDDNYIYLYENRLSKIVDDDCKQITLFFKAKYLSSLIRYKHSFALSRPDIGCIHSCIIIEK